MATTTKFVPVKGVVSDAISATVGALPVEVLENSIASLYTCTVDVPVKGTSISSIKLFYRRQHAGNLYLKFRSSYIDVATVAAVTNDADSLTAYAGGGTDGYITSATVPAAAYSDIASVLPGNILGIEVQRDATNALDTYESDLQIVGFQFVFVLTDDAASTYQTSYCNITSDLYRLYPRIEEFKEQRTIRGWVVYSGSVYKKANAGYGEMLFENGVPLTSVGSAGLVTAGKFYYDADTDTLYAQATTGAITATTITCLWGIDWDTVKTWAVEQSSARIEAMLDPKHPRPIPENPRGTSSRKWDGAFTNAVAYMALSILVGRQDAPKFNMDGSSANVAADLFMLSKKIIDQYNNGEMAFSWQITKDEIGGYEIFPATTNTSVGMFQLRGEYTGTEDDTWKVKVTTGGALGTGAYALSLDGGTTYETAVTTVDTHAWQTLSNGVDIRWFDRGGAASSLIVNDTWTIELTRSTATQTRSRVGSITLIG